MADVSTAGGKGRMTPEERQATRRAEKLRRKLLYKGEGLFYFINDAILVIALILVAYPLIFIVSASFSSPAAVVANKVFLWPVDVSLEGYTAVFKEAKVWMGYANTIFYTVFGTAISIALTVMCAYPLSRKDLIGHNGLMFFVTFTMIFNGGMLPTYIVIRQLGMLDTRWAILLPTAIGVYNVIVTRTYFQTNISDELLEAAFLDGSDNLKFIWSIVLPLSKPIIAVMILFYAVGQWNSYFNAFIYLKTREIMPLQLFLREILVATQITSDMMYDAELAAAKQGLYDLLKYSLILVSSIPIWCAYPFVQKHFVKGIMVGAIKG